MSENSNFDADYDNGSLINVSDPSSFSSQQLLECLNYNRKLQDNLTLRLKSIEEARKQNLNHQKWVTEFASSHGLINDFKNGPNQEERENSQRKARYQVNLPCIITGDNEEDARLKELANFEYLPYFVGNHEEAPLESFEKMQKDKPTPLVKNARRWQLREISILAAAVRQENMRLKIEGLLKRTNGPNSRKGLDASDKSAGEPPMEVWQVRKLPDRELELNLKGLNWEKIAQNILGRSPKECAIRWTCYDHPLINKADWTDEEELKLAQIAKSYNYRNWQAIASELNTNRTAIQCFHQYQTKMNHGLVRKRWTKEEDNILREAVKVYGERNWQQIAQCLVNRTGQQCLHRWAKALNPAIKRGRWTPEEDEVLKAAVAKYGAHSWVKIQPHVKGRTDVQCRERWMNVLHPGIDDSYWNPYEDAHLLSLVNKIGVGKWSSISQELSNRTDNQCWRRWKSQYQTTK
ncbi:hypothetical protein K502DRAFT_225978 [Neoconidiobolus thromboides FSU 785]|nr:hypothetical protein K502DRAFT_225978 [Neoconidiobolus thromboides FSU 785]